MNASCGVFLGTHPFSVPLYPLFSMVFSPNFWPPRKFCYHNSCLNYHSHRLYSVSISWHNLVMEFTWKYYNKLIFSKVLHVLQSATSTSKPVLIHCSTSIPTQLPLESSTSCCPHLPLRIIFSNYPNISLNSVRLHQTKNPTFLSWGSIIFWALPYILLRLSKAFLEIGRVGVNLLHTFYAFHIYCLHLSGSIYSR